MQMWVFEPQCAAQWLVITFQYSTSSLGPTKLVFMERSWAKLGCSLQMFAQLMHFVVEGMIVRCYSRGEMADVACCSAIPSIE